jgi:hypothetical protein
LALRHREFIVALVAKHRLPAVYPGRVFVADGGLIFSTSTDALLATSTASLRARSWRTYRCDRQPNMS